VIGPLITAFGYALFMRPGIDGNYWLTFFPPVVVLGLGMAISVAPLTTAVMNSVAQHRAGIASGVNNAVARTAGLVAIAVFGIVMLQVFRGSLDRHLTTSALPASVVESMRSQSTKLAAITVSDDGDPAIQETIRRAIDESFVSGFRVVMLIGAALAIGGAVTTLVFAGTPTRDEPA